MDKGLELRSKLNNKQLRFCQGIADGLTQRESYTRAYGAKKTADNTDACASRLLSYAKVKAYIDYLRLPTEEARVLSRQRKREILCTIAEGEDTKVKPSEKVAAIKTDNQMTGDDAPVRVEGEITLNNIMQALEPTTGLPDE